MDDIPRVLRNAPYHDIRLIVATDNERILGLGDQGCGGMGIPIGKLALYVAGAGIHPSKCLPISLDVGTTTPICSPIRSTSATQRGVCAGATTTRSSKRSSAACGKCTRARSFNGRIFIKTAHSSCSSATRDDCLRSTTTSKAQASVAVGGLLAALRITKQKMAEQRMAFVGAGAACTGIARLCAIAMRADGASETTVRRALFAIDSQGLLHDGRIMDEPHKRELAVPRELMIEYGLDPNATVTPLDVIRAVKPTILVGATARAGTFTQGMIETMARNVNRPIVLPLSNPTSKAECTPEQAIRWTDGRAIVATGSPFADVQHDGKRHVVGQANNVFIFPGVGLAVAIAEAHEVTTEMFHIASATLARLVSQERLDVGAIYPHQSELRRVSFEIACAVVRYASDHNLGRRIDPNDVEATVRAAVWDPSYVPVCTPRADR